VSAVLAQKMPLGARLILPLCGAVRSKKSRQKKLGWWNSLARSLLTLRRSCSNAETVDRGFTVTDDLDRQVRQALQRQKRTPGIFLISAVLLAAIAAAVGYFWLNYNNRIRSASFAGQPAVAPVAASGEETVLLKDFHSFQQQAADSLRSAAQDIAAQKTDLKSLSDQVSALSAKIDAMQSAEQPTGSASAPVDVRSGSQQLAVPARTFAVGARKRLPAPKASGPISVGGAALPPPTDR
jgi:hypothetical protein